MTAATICATLPLIERKRRLARLIGNAKRRAIR
jgi:hypothetical protein